MIDELSSSFLEACILGSCSGPWSPSSSLTCSVSGAQDGNSLCDACPSADSDRLRSREQWDSMACRGQGRNAGPG